MTADDHTEKDSFTAGVKLATYSVGSLWFLYAPLVLASIPGAYHTKENEVLCWMDRSFSVYATYTVSEAIILGLALLVPVKLIKWDRPALALTALLIVIALKVSEVLWVLSDCAP